MHNPENFIIKQESLKLESFTKKTSKFSFFTSNSSFSFSKAVLSFLFGANWTKSFDLILSDCNKPLFQRS